MVKLKKNNVESIEHAFPGIPYILKRDFLEKESITELLGTCAILNSFTIQ
jgi:hypothetical protein